MIRTRQALKAAAMAKVSTSEKTGLLDPMGHGGLGDAGRERGGDQGDQQRDGGLQSQLPKGVGRAFLESRNLMDELDEDRSSKRPPPRIADWRLTTKLKGWARVREAFRHGGAHRLTIPPPQSKDRPVDVEWHLRESPLFARCPSHLFTEVAQACTTLTVQRYSVLYREGAVAHGGTLFIVARGAVALKGFDDVKRLIVPAGSVQSRQWGYQNAFGLEAVATDSLYSGRRRAETATVDTRSVLISVPVEVIPNVVAEEARIHSNIRLLRPGNVSHSIFKDMTKTQLRVVARLVAFQFCPVGERVLVQGEVNDAFFTLVWGELTVMVESATIEQTDASALIRKRTGQTIVDVVKPDSDNPHFGEQPFMRWADTGQVGMTARNATLVASQPSWLVVMYPAHFPTLLDLVPGIIQRFEASKRLQRRNHQFKAEQAAEDLMRKVAMRQEHKSKQRMEVVKKAIQHRVTDAFSPYFLFV